jgi:hypothetical protein
MSRHAASRRRTPGLPTRASQVDHVVSAILGDRLTLRSPDLGAELAAARALRADLPLVPAAPRFEEALARRLSREAGPRSGGWLQRFVRHHQRLILTGALGSVLISTAGAAIVAWRLVHR